MGICFFAYSAEERLEQFHAIVRWTIAADGSTEANIYLRKAQMQTSPFRCTNKKEEASASSFYLPVPAIYRVIARSGATWQSPGTIHRNAPQKQTLYWEIPTGLTALGMTENLQFSVGAGHCPAHNRKDFDCLRQCAFAPKIAGRGTAPPLQ